MSETLLFPGLGIGVKISRVAFTVGGYAVYWYGIFFALAFLAGVCYFQVRAREFGIHPYDGLDVILWAIIGGVVGARLYYVAFEWEMYRDNLLKIFALREGGLAIYGGVIGAALTGLIACRLKKLPYPPMLDVGFTGLLLGQAIGRWGNFFNMEAFGSNTTLPWGMTSERIANYLFDHAAELEVAGVSVDPTLPVHPTFLYESLWNLLGFLLLAFVVTRRRKYDGQVSLCYLAWYGFGRMMIEGLRTDSLMWGPFRVSQMLALLLFVVSTMLLLVFALRGRKRETQTGEGSGWTLYRDTEESRSRIARVEKEIRDGNSKKTDKAREQDAPQTPESEAEPGGEASPSTGPDRSADGEEPFEKQENGNTDKADPAAGEQANE